MFFDNLIRLFGKIQEERVESTLGPGIRRSFHLGPYRAVSDTIYLYRGGLLHMKHLKGCFEVSPGWIIQKKDRNMPSK